MAAADSRISNVLRGLPASGGSGQWPADSNANSGPKPGPGGNSDPQKTILKAQPASFGKRVGAAVLKRKPKAGVPSYA